MPWGKIDDQLYDHTKVEALDDTEGRPPASWRLLGVGLQTVAISWSNRHLTDGHIPARKLPMLTGMALAEAQKVARALVQAGIWEPAEGGYAIHDFLVYNQSKEQVEAIREVRSSAGKIGGAKRGEQLRAAREPDRKPSKAPSNVADILSSTLPSNESGNESSKSQAARLTPRPVPSDSRPVDSVPPTPTAPTRSRSRTDEELRAESIDRARAKLADPTTSADVRQAAIFSLQQMGVPWSDQAPDFGAEAPA